MHLIMMLHYTYTFIIFFIVSLQLKSKLKNHQHKCQNVGDSKQNRHLANFDLVYYIYIYISVMQWWPIPLPRPTVHVRKFKKWRPMIMQSIIDRFGKTDYWLWKSSRFPTLVTSTYLVTCQQRGGERKDACDALCGRCLQEDLRHVHRVVDRRRHWLHATCPRCRHHRRRHRVVRTVWKIKCKVCNRDA